MTNAPKRIWIEDEFGDAGYNVEYVRADLALPAVQPDAAAIREAALRETLVALRGAGSFGRTAAEKHSALEQYCMCRDAILDLIDQPAVQPDREHVAFSMWKAEADRAAPNVGKHRIPLGFAVAAYDEREKWLGLADAAIRSMLETGKEVMPDVSNDPAHAPDAAPAGLSAGGGAGWLEQLRAETANVAVIVTGEGPHFEYWRALQFAYESGQLVAAGLSAGGGAEKMALCDAIRKGMGTLQPAVQPDAATLIRWHDMLMRDYPADLSSIVCAEMLALVERRNP